jgi:predicted nucleic acid-binding protein
MGDVPVVEADYSDTMFLRALIQAMREPGGVSVNLITMDGHLLDMERRESSDQRLQGRILTPKSFLKKLGW